MSDLKQAIKQNYIKCVQDPSYFINQYCTIQHPQRGKIKFSLYPFQYDVLKEYDYITKEEMDQKPGGKDNRLLRLIPPGDNYLFFTEKRGCKNPVFKWKSRYWTFLLKLSPNRPSWTIQASFSHNQGPFHWKNRFLRIEELKRLQTIPDSYKLHGDFKQQWKQVGNAFPTLLAKIIAKEILQK